MSQQHTPTPWMVQKHECPHSWISQKGDYVRGLAKIYGDTNLETEANAAFIVRACNSHEALVKALEDLIGSETGCWKDGREIGMMDLLVLGKDIVAARAALKLAKEA